MQAWLVLVAISLGLSVPVLVSSYYSLILFFGALAYPRRFESNESVGLDRFPNVSVFLASYNERNVIRRTLLAIGELDYPREKLQVVIADDSTDETCQIIFEEAGKLNSSGIATIVSRRATREGFKSGALNNASKFLIGEYVLLLDADSVVSKKTLRRGLEAFKYYKGISFVSYRVGHYNRNQNITTRLFALSQDMGDTITKMGSSVFGSPFSFQGGFALLKRTALEEVGFWANDTIVDDADVSCKLYLSGRKGIYLSNERIQSEDPSSLSVWKRQAARVSQGWAHCFIKYKDKVLKSKNLGFGSKVALLLFLLTPMSNLVWIFITFLSSLALTLGVGIPANSIFADPVYIIAVSLPALSFVGAGMYSLHIQKILDLKNILLLPMLSFAVYCMFADCSVGFIEGLMGKSGFFFRTPKSGLGGNAASYLCLKKSDRASIIEGILSFTAIVLSIGAAEHGVWFLAGSLAVFAVLTLSTISVHSIPQVKMTTELKMVDAVRPLILYGYWNRIV